MSDITITYDTIYEILRLEKTRKEIQELNRDFFQNLLSYIKEKQYILETQQKDSIFSKEFEKTQKQLQNIKKMLKELYERRESKIIQQALYSSRSQEKPVPNNLLAEEKELLISITHLLNKYRKEILFNLLKNKLPEITKEEQITEKPRENKLIRLTHPLPKFVGDDLNVYGPSEEEDILHLPEKVANVIISRNRGKEIKT